MREVMLDLVQRCTEALAWECLCQEFRNLRAAIPIAPPRVDQPRIRSMTEQIAQLTNEVGPAVLINRNVVHVTQSNSRLTQAILNRLGRKAGPVLHTAKSLLLGGGHEHAVPHHGRRRIRVEGVKSEDDQASVSLGVVKHERRNCITNSTTGAPV